MPEIRDDKPLVPSILDRLLDDEPERREEHPKSRHQILRELKESIRRDLHNLLNTRWRCSAWPPGLDELECSLVNYGMPEFSGNNVWSTDPEEFRQLLERVIRRYEPRFKTVKVSLLKNTDRSDRSLRFRIDVLVNAQPAPEPLVFDSTLEPTDCTFAVESENR